MLTLDLISSLSVPAALPHSTSWDIQKPGTNVGAVCACRWTGLFAYNKANGQMLPNCVAFAGAERDPARQQELFGGCGVAPTQLMGLPTSACSEADSAMPSTLLVCGLACLYCC